MLVEGGYLHSMKRLIEKAEEEQLARSPVPRPPRRPANVVRRSLEKLARLLGRRRES